ncbi:tRNA methyltransferase complex GCD14 subunit [Fistulina hepatica ATCC 64428]|uniref:tRNA (adenine(58)-N(1))-methyltransferase catalytic subunit TRM61 n=1 Tax=Fistulina hepatica ATCC 64428 TaxID=1128425 RepID=A0A0D7AII4_9AGAR|nr:tRNA methyltransferase complex GCD14 subunit [Fistulina hepatica ATCC 64428]
MWSTAREIASGDLTRDLVQPLVVTPGKEFNSKYGNYRHSDFVGLPYGSKVGSHAGKGYIHVLRPTPELWTMALPHRTQILYLADIAFVTAHLNIKPGSRVIEAGTGSGSFSHSVARTIGEAGHLWSYEFHETRVNKAREEFAEHGISHIVTLTHRNVCKDGFTVTNEVDAVFLDLPGPWDAVDHAKSAMKKDRETRICCFSPCMEQVMRTVNALNDAGFVDIKMFETLLRPHEVIQNPVMPTIAQAGEKLKKAEVRREEKRQRQMAASRSARMHDHGAKRKREDTLEQDDDPTDVANSKRVKVEDEGMADLAAAPNNNGAITANGRNMVEMSVGAGATSTLESSEPSAAKVAVSKVLPEVRGHTSYLTFASLLPAIQQSTS